MTRLPISVRDILFSGLASIALASGLTGCSTRATVNHTDSSPAAQTHPSLSRPASTASVPPASPGDETGTLNVQGQQRTYWLHTPRAYRSGQPMPLVLAFHGYGSQGKDLAEATGLSQFADQQGFLVVYPDGIDRRWHLSDFNLTGVDDLALVPRLIEHLAQIRSVDRRHIYATGVSNGGFLVQRLACQFSEQIAAFASVAATVPGQLPPLCGSAQPVSMLMINGTADRKVPWEGGAPPKVPYGWILSVPDSINFWQQHDRCSGPPQTAPSPASRVEITRFLNCQNGTEVEQVVLKGAGHVWPRGGSGSDRLINSSQEIWNFFKRHQK